MLINFTGACKFNEDTLKAKQIKDIRTESKCYKKSLFIQTTTKLY